MRDGFFGSLPSRSMPTLKLFLFRGNGFEKKYISKIKK
jgi:hypothetical protein